MPSSKRKRRTWVVDSHGLLLYLQKEAGWKEMGHLLRGWQRDGVQAKLSWINWGEIYYISWKYFGKEKAVEVRNLLTALPLELEPVDLDLVTAASEVKAENNLSYADAFCAATALRYDAILVTGDPEFRSLEERIDIHWL